MNNKNNNDKVLLGELNEEINKHELHRTKPQELANSIQFFTKCLHFGFRFKRANDGWINKSEYIESLKAEDAFKDRRISDIDTVHLEGDQAVVRCIVTCEKKDDGSIHRYRNIRIFKKVEGQWLLHSWYNYEIKDTSTQ